MVDVNSAQISAKTKESSNLDFLRAVAVMLVLVDHVIETQGKRLDLWFHPWDWYLGRLGVLMFFVHTTIVLMRSMSRLEVSGLLLFIVFYLRRGFRIYPLSIVCILFSFAAQIPQLPWLEFTWRGWGNLVSNLALTQNITYSEPVLAPLWSLPLEIQMYLMLPFIFLIAKRWQGILPMACIYLLSILLAVFQPMILGRLSVITYVPCFMAGCFAFTLFDKTVPKLPGWVWPLTLLALTLGYIFLEQLDPAMHPQPVAWLFCGLLGVTIPFHKELSWVWLRRVCHEIAKYSYGIYLLHVIVLYLAFYCLSIAPLGQWIVFIVMMVVLPVAVFHFLEQPLIAVGIRVANSTIANFRQNCRPKNKN